MESLVIGQSVKIVNVLGVVEDGYSVCDDQKDRKGCILLSKAVIRDDREELESYRVHHSRIFIEDFATTTAIKCGDDILTACPKCGMVVTVVDNVANCHIHGGFAIEIAQEAIKQPSKDKKHAATEVVEKIIEKVDMAQLSEVGELWIKNGASFNGKNEIMPCAMIFANQGRHITFNIYDGTFGRKGNKPPIDDILNGSDCGYLIKDVDKLRAKLSQKGYTLYK